MDNRFASGTKPIPVGVTEFAVTGLALRFAPGAITVSARQPTNDSDIISAYVVGEVTENGFTVALSSPVSVEGYLLDWHIFSSGEIAPVAGDTLAMDYTTLQKEVAHYLGYDAAELTERQITEIDYIIQSGVRRFYYPPQTEGVDADFEWSFLRQTGNLQTAAGVGAYALPDGFGRFAGQIAVEGEYGKTIPLIPYGDIVRMRQNGNTGRPVFAAVMNSNVFGERGQKKQVIFYPTPDREYDLSFVCDADTGKIDAENRPFPLGGAMFAELVKESCLAVAEQSSNDEKSLHTQNFNELLVAMIARDRKSGAQCFGDLGDPEAREMEGFQPLRTRGCLY